MGLRTVCTGGLALCSRWNKVSLEIENGLYGHVEFTGEFHRQFEARLVPIPFDGDDGLSADANPIPHFFLGVAGRCPECLEVVLQGHVSECSVQVELVDGLGQGNRKE